MVAPSTRPTPNLRPGMMIGDKYRIERELGRGGFGVVVRAMHLTLDRRVAIKVLLEDETSTEAEWVEDAARFRREAKATAALRSAHVVQVLDVDVLDSGHPYIVMEFLQGRTLHEIVYTSPALPIEDAVDYAIQILAALADAHAAGIVHRDLKPANVVLSTGVGGGPLVKVLDFGVSKMVAASSHRLTKTGAVVGTVAYMAPEQMQDAKRVDGRADLWSVGLVLYEALARTHPFGAAAAGPGVVTSIVNEAIQPLRAARPDVPLDLEAVVLRLLEKKPEHRYATAIDAALALAPFAPLRSRPVLDEVRRAALPSGAARAVHAIVGGDAAKAPGGEPVRRRLRSFFRAFFVSMVLFVALFVLGLRVAPERFRSIGVGPWWRGEPTPSPAPAEDDARSMVGRAASSSSAAEAGAAVDVASAESRPDASSAPPPHVVVPSTKRRAEPATDPR